MTCYIQSLDTLMQENTEYKGLYEEQLSVISDLEVYEDDELKNIINDFIDVSAEVNAYENKFLYKKGYSDCLKLFRYLQNL